MNTDRNVLLCACLITGLLTQVCHAAPLRLTLYLNIEARQFLNATNQSIVIVVPDPSSEGDNSVVAINLPPPITDSMVVVIEPKTSIYVAHGVVSSAQAFKIGRPAPSRMATRTASTVIKLTETAKARTAAWVSTTTHPQRETADHGQALFIYDSDTGKPASPSPINGFTLNPFQSRQYPQPAAVIWALIGSNISSGSVLPKSVLKSVSPYLSDVNASTQGRSSFQISRYLEVPFNEQNQASIHFDLSLNAFERGPYPK